MYGFMISARKYEHDRASCSKEGIINGVLVVPADGAYQKVVLKLAISHTSHFEISSSMTGLTQKKIEP